jgi:Flp pilus assembly protein TadG
MAGRIASLIGRRVLPRRQGFRHDESGATAIEFGMLALPFFALIGAILETAIVLLSGEILDSAVQDVSRLVRTGQIQKANMQPDEFKLAVCDRLFGLFRDCDELHIEMDVVGGFSEIEMTPPVNWQCDEDEDPVVCNSWTRPESFSPGGASEFVTVQAYYKWPLIVPFGGLGLGNLPDGRRLLGSATAFLNEPF